MNRIEIKQQGKAIAKAQWGELLLVLVIPVCAAIFAGIFTLGIGAVVVAGPLAVGALKVYNEAASGNQADKKILLEVMKSNFGEMFLASILLDILKSIVTIALTVGFTTIVGSLAYSGIAYMFYGGSYLSAGSIITIIIAIALAVASIYFLLSFAMVNYIFVREEDAKALYAFKKSKEMMQGNIGSLLLLVLSFIGWGILCTLTAGILLVWVAPYFRSTLVVFFKGVYDGNNYVMKSVEKDRTTRSLIGKIVPEKDDNEMTVDYSNEADEKSAEENCCPNCGAKLPDGARFCGICGYALEVDGDDADVFVEEGTLDLNEKTVMLETPAKKQKNKCLTLVSQDNDNRLTLIIDKSEYLIGKKADMVDGAIEFNPGISRVHCKVVCEDNVNYIIDLNSVNKTYINGEVLTPNTKYQINDDDIIRIATSEFKVETFEF